MTDEQPPAARRHLPPDFPRPTPGQAQRVATLLKGRPDPGPTPEQRAEERAKREAIGAEMQQGLHDLEAVMAERTRQEREEHARLLAEYEAKQAEGGEGDE